MVLNDYILHIGRVIVDSGS